MILVSLNDYEEMEQYQWRVGAGVLGSSIFSLGSGTSDDYLSRFERESHSTEITL